MLTRDLTHCVVAVHLQLTMHVAFIVNTECFNMVSYLLVYCSSCVRWSSSELPDVLLCV